MATFGKIKPFNPLVDDWTIYQEKLQFFFTANGISGSLVPDGKLDAEEVTYASLVELLQSHYTKKQSIIVHRFHFNCRSRKTDESIAEYVAALRELALNCKFEKKELLEEMICDRFVCGVNHPGLAQAPF